MTNLHKCGKVMLPPQNRRVSNTGDFDMQKLKFEGPGNTERSSVTEEDRDA